MGLAGEWSIAVPQGNDAVSRKLRRELWAAWWNASDGSACAAYAGILVTPPNETHTVKVPWDGGCSALQIHPVVLGTTGQG